MTAFVISEVEALHKDQAQRYRTLAARSVAAYGGRYLVRGGQPVVVEGNWPSEQQISVLEFPSMTRIREWYASPEYAEALAVARAALRRRLIFVEGVEAGSLPG